MYTTYMNLHTYGRDTDMYTLGEDNTLTITAPIDVLWEAAIEHLAKQGRPSGSIMTGCVYKSHWGLSCAVGFINPDWFHQHEEKSVDATAELKADDTTLSFLLDMQNAHDTAQNIMELYINLWRVAIRFNLSVDPIYQIEQWNTGNDYRLTSISNTFVEKLPVFSDQLKERFDAQLFSYWITDCPVDLKELGMFLPREAGFYGQRDELFEEYATELAEIESTYASIGINMEQYYDLCDTAQKTFVRASNEVLAEIIKRHSTGDSNSDSE